jgi:multiple sugar transport system ATP-binding protein
MTMGELVVVMKDGVIQQQGAPLEIYNDPVNRFVAEFIGSPSMNFVTGTFDPRDGAAHAEIGLRLSLRPDAAPAGPLFFGVRPEHLRREEQPGFAALDGTVEVVEPLGAETLLEVNVRGTALTARLPGDVLPRIGAPLRLFVDPARVYLFNSDGSRFRQQGGTASR